MPRSTHALTFGLVPVQIFGDLEGTVAACQRGLENIRCAAEDSVELQRTELQLLFQLLTPSTWAIAGDGIECVTRPPHHVTL